MALNKSDIQCTPNVYLWTPNSEILAKGLPGYATVYAISQSIFKQHENLVCNLAKISIRKNYGVYSIHLVFEVYNEGYDMRALVSLGV